MEFLNINLVDVIKAALVVMQARSFSSLAQNMTSTVDPIEAFMKGVKLIVDVCAPPHVKYPIKCAVLLLQLGVCVGTGGLTSVTSVSLAIGTGKQILEAIDS